MKMDVRARGSAIYHVRRDSGLETERHVGLALEGLQDQGYIISHWPADKHEDFFEGVDHHIITSQGDEIGFQVKSSERGRRESLVKHPETRVFVTKLEETIESIQNRLVVEFDLRK